MDQLFPIVASILYIIYVGSFVIALLLDNERDSTSTVSWLAIFLLLPILGPILYLLIGRNWRKLYSDKTDKSINRAENTAGYRAAMSRQSVSKEMISKSTVAEKISKMLYFNSYSDVLGGNSVKAFHNGTDKFEALFRDFENAKESIHIDYFIWRNDKLTQKVKEVLIKKAKEGVEIRIIIDSLGCLGLGKEYKKELRDAGIKIEEFFNIFKLKYILTLNHRSHRKSVIIDGKIGYLGGINMGQEYIDGGERFETWRDTHVRVTGDSVLGLQKIFADAWKRVTKEDLFNDKYFPVQEQNGCDCPIQIATSGPDSDWRSIQELYFSIINGAKETLYVQSPYFIPDTSIHQAFMTAAMMGVDVRIMVAGVPDKKIPYWTAFTYFEDLIKAGVKIYHYNAGFIHTKMMVADSKMVTMGTANMDVRSFRLNYEVNMMIYGEDTATEFHNVFMKDVTVCKEFTEEDMEKFTLGKRIRNSFARLLSPLQ